MVQEEAESPARAQHAADFGQRLLERADVLENEARDDGVEAGIGEGQRVGAGAGVRRTAGSALGLDDLGDGRVDTHHRGRPAGGCQPRDLALSAADVEHALVAGEVLGGQRQDLFDVLGVGAFSEPFLPPAGVGLPQLIVQRTPTLRCAQ